MAKTKQEKKGSKKTQPQESPEELYALAIASLETSQPEEALQYAQKLLSVVQPTDAPTQRSLPALNLLGEINVELGEIDAAREYFTRAVAADPDCTVPEELGGGAEKFLWLAQLCEQGGAESVSWFEKGAAVLKKEIAQLEDPSSRRDQEEREALLEEKRGKLANALCGVVEVYMTDLSWEEDAEQRCEALVTEALMVAPEKPEILQTLASVRLSQMKIEDAQSALRRSISLWSDLDPEDPDVPDFPLRISLSRLLMEAEMEEEAMEVLERLALEDDQSVEACYLGGWCLHLLSEKRKQQANGAMTDGESTESKQVLAAQKASRSWLLNTLKLYKQQDYEDERLRDHTNELVEELNKVLGPPPAEKPDGEEDDEEEEDWEDDGEDAEDEEMGDA